MHQRSYLFALALWFVFSTGCKKSDEYPLEPVITFKSLTTVKNVQGYDDHGVLEISFTDGDGDIGLDSSEINIPPYTGEYRYVVHAIFYKKVNGVWINDSQYDDRGWFRIITPEGSQKAIRGDILKDQIGFPMPVTALPVRFEVYIYDRALHKSNTITTPQIIITTPPP